MEKKHVDIHIITIKTAKSTHINIINILKDFILYIVDMIHFKAATLREERRSGLVIFAVQDVRVYV